MPGAKVFRYDLTRTTTGRSHLIGAGDGKPEKPRQYYVTGAEERQSKHPGAVFCRKCDDPFQPTGDEDRARPIHLCPRCRLDLQEEGELNELDPMLSDDALMYILGLVATVEGRIARTLAEAAKAETEGRYKRMLNKRRRAERLEERLGQIKTGRMASMGGVQF